MNKTSRRQMLVGGTALAASGCFPDVGGEWAQLTAECTDGETVTPVTAPSAVAETMRDDAVLVDATTRRNTIVAAPVRSMLDAVLTALVPGGHPWRTILPDWTAATRIGIKVNALNPSCPTSPLLVRAVVDSLVEELGASRDTIIVWDRRLRELTAAGYTEEIVGAKLMGTVDSVGYGDSCCGVVANAVPRLSRILTEVTDLTINMPVLKKHGICGVTGALKNTYGVIDNPGDYHTNINTALPQLYRLPLIRRRFRFHILDALVAVTNGDTASRSDAVPRRLLASTDPVALDCRATALVDELRHHVGYGPVDRSIMGWLKNAQAAGLGSNEYHLVGS